MKKFLIMAILLIANLPLSSNAIEIQEWRDGNLQQKISEIGFKILNANGIENRTVFYFLSDSKRINAFFSSIDRSVNMYKGMAYYLQDDDEFAGIISHEIGHAQDSYKGTFRGMFFPLAYGFHTKQFEKRADKKAVDYMVKAGYHPVAYIVALNKVGGQYRYEWWFSSYPLTSKRLMYIYEYIYRKYPQYLVNNPYKNNVYYQNFLLTSSKNREKFEKHIKNPSDKNAKLNYK